jgi:hypothetical protein
MPFIRGAFKMMVDPSQERSVVSRFLSKPNSLVFLNKMEEYNAVFGQQQIENIHHTLSLMDHHHKQEKIDHLVKQSIQRCIYWCTRYNVPYYTTLFDA